MTEYDYSPAAYERHMAKQEGVSRWVNRQAHEAHRYANPFLPYQEPSQSPPQPSSSQQQKGSNSSSSYASSSQNTSGRSRSVSLSRSGSSPKTYVAAVEPDSRSSSNSHSHSSHSRSKSQRHTRPPPSKSQSYRDRGVIYHEATDSGSRRSSSSSSPTQYIAQAGQPVIVQSGKTTHVVIPKTKTLIEVHSPESYEQYVSTRGSSSEYTQSPTITTTTTSSHHSKKDQSLLKRLFSTKVPEPRKSSSTDSYLTYSNTSGSTVTPRRRTTSVY